MDFERLKEFLGDLWRAMLDYWGLTIIILLFITTPVGAAIFGILKLIDVSKEKHKYDD